MTLTDSTDAIAAVVSDFCNRRIVVCGDAILDEYVHGDCSRISPEAPVPVLRVGSVRRVLGGAANTAANIASLGGHATLIAPLGRDDSARTMVRCAVDAGVDLKGVEHDGPTVKKTRIIGQQQQIVRLDYEEVREPDPQAEHAALALLDSCIGACDVVVVSDYAKGFVSPALAAGIVEAAHRAGRPVVVDPRPQHRDRYVGCDYITPNWREARALLRWPESESSPAAAAAVARALASELTTNVVLTLGPDGIHFCSRTLDEQFALPTLAQEVFDVSGAGDTVVAAFALALASGADHATAVHLANRAASVVVAKFGTATVSPEEIVDHGDNRRLVGRASLRRLAGRLRAADKRIVTINGAFDVLHGGHLHILGEARRQGDVLIVGLHSDASVRRDKGPSRPVIPEHQRAQMLLALRVVDYVHIVDESDPRAFLAEVHPDVHVSGSEYGEECVAHAVVRRAGGRLHVVPRLPDLSTTRLLSRLREPADG